MFHLTETIGSLLAERWLNEASSGYLCFYRRVVACKWCRETRQANDVQDNLVIALGLQLHLWHAPYGISRLLPLESAVASLQTLGVWDIYVYTYKEVHEDTAHNCILLLNGFHSVEYILCSIYKYIFPLNHENRYGNKIMIERHIYQPYTTYMHVRSNIWRCRQNIKKKYGVSNSPRRHVGMLLFDQSSLNAWGWDWTLLLYTKWTEKLRISALL